MKLYVQSPTDTHVSRVLIAARYAGVEFEVIDNVPAEKLAEVSADGRLPVLETDSGYVGHSNAIMRYIARLVSSEVLLGDGAAEKGAVDQWLDFSANEVEPSAAVWTFPIQRVEGMPAVSAEASRVAKDSIRACLGSLNTHLANKTFMVSQRVSLADISLATALVSVFKLVLTTADRAAFPHAFRWFLTCVHQPEFEAVLGQVALHAGTPVVAGSAPAAAASAGAAGFIGAAALSTEAGSAECNYSIISPATTLFRRERTRVQQIMDAGLAWEGRQLTVSGYPPAAT